MEFLYEEHLKIVAGANGAYDPAMPVLAPVKASMAMVDRRMVL